LAGHGDTSPFGFGFVVVFWPPRAFRCRTLLPAVIGAARALSLVPLLPSGGSPPPVGSNVLRPRFGPERESDLPPLIGPSLLRSDLRSPVNNLLTYRKARPSSYSPLLGSFLLLEVLACEKTAPPKLGFLLSFTSPARRIDAVESPRSSSPCPPLPLTMPRYVPLLASPHLLESVSGQRSFHAPVPNRDFLPPSFPADRFFPKTFPFFILPRVHDAEIVILGTGRIP